MQTPQANKTRSTTAVSILLLTAAGMALVEARAAEDSAPGVEILTLQSARIGEEVVFAVQLKRPADMSWQTVGQAWRQSGWPRMAQLRGQPVWTVPCYPEYELENYWQPIPPLDRLTFIGRCPAEVAIDLTFRYPIAGGKWADAPVRLNLAEAKPLPDDPPALERWVLAQSQWFEVLARQTGDLGGFYTFAAQQSRRQHDLPMLDPDDNRFRRRWGTRQNPEEQFYALTTGGLAVQESLQLDRMTETDRDRGEPVVPIEDIPAVGIQSHPFDRMRGEKQPVHSELARLVPETQYYVHFTSIAKLLEVLDFAEQWGPSLLRLASPVGTNYRTRPRTHAQLCLPDNVLTRRLGPSIVAEVALTGSDPYLRGGSDITALFAVRNKEAFQTAVDLPFRQARAANPDANYDEVTYGSVTIERLVQPGRQVSCHRCWLGEGGTGSLPAGVCVYSNSLAAIRRIIDTHAGRRARLADAPGFRYMRAVVFPHDPDAEDGFVYLSDPFIRSVVGPELRIKQKRRLEAVTSLKLLTNAVMYYGYQHGPAQPGFDDLVNDKSLHPDDLYDPEGGTITWDAQARIARSSIYGDLSFLTPLIEIDTTRATAEERDAYARFRQRYQRYWREYFDPIGVRIKADRTIRLETCILPLINSTAYERLEDTSGGEPVVVRLDRFTPDTLFRYVMKIERGILRTQALTLIGAMTNATTDWVGDWATFWVEDTDAFSSVVRFAYEDADLDAADRGEREREQVLDVFNATLVFGVHVKNKLSLAAFLVSIRAFVETTAPDLVVFNNLQPYKGVTIVQIAPDPGGEIARELGLHAAEPEEAATSQSLVSERGPAIYYASIRDGLYVSTQASALRGLIDQLGQADAEEPVAAEAVSANVLIYAAPGAAELIRPAVDYLLEQQARAVSLGNLAQVWLLGRCGLLDQGTPLERAARSYLGYELVCPNGGAYRYDAASDEAFSSIYGPLSSPERLDKTPADSPLGRLLDALKTVTASLRITEDGLETTVAIERR